jgi:hypothetical protein
MKNNEATDANFQNSYALIWHLTETVVICYLRIVESCYVKINILFHILTQRLH